MLANLTHNDETMTGQAYTLTWFYVRMDTSKLYFSNKNISSKSRWFKIGTKWKPRPAKTLQICTQFMAGRLISYIWFNFVLIYFEWFWISPEKTMLFWDFCLYGVISHLGIWLRGSSIWNWKVRKQRDKDLMQFLAFFVKEEYFWLEEWVTCPRMKQAGLTALLRAGGAIRSHIFNSAFLEHWS